MKKTIEVVFFIYYAGTGISALYFNWQYANEHGFLAWLFFGELIATAKAFIWPVFLFIG